LFLFQKGIYFKTIYNYMTRYIFNNDNNYLTTDNEKISISLSYHNMIAIIYIMFNHQPIIRANMFRR